ncbi:MAG: N-acetyltransferase [Myxococcales bacterium]|nr:MAG: N-acetyltransferase [Myxococcales bacterium]
MSLKVRSIRREDAEAIIHWRYEPPYDVYNAEGDPEARRELLGGAYRAVETEHGELVGFFCLGPNAQVDGARTRGLYADRGFVDLGLGMRPDQTGQGLGAAFVETCLAWGREQLHPQGFRLSVAAFNARAIAVYTRVGFEKVASCVSDTPQGRFDFEIMVRREAGRR